MLFKKNKPAPSLTEFEYSSRGGMRGCHYVYSARRTENGSRIVTEESEGFQFPVRRQRYDVSAALMDALSEITSKHKVYTWQNLKTFEDRLLDAPSLNVYFRFGDGTTVRYGHEEILPEYGVHKEIIEVIKANRKNENSDVSLKEPEQNAEDSEIHMAVESAENGYLSVSLINKTDSRIEPDFSYKVYKDENLLCEGCVEQEEYRRAELYPDFKLPLLVNLNECGKLHEGVYTIEMLGTKCTFELIK